MINSVKMGQLKTLISMYETLNDRMKVTRQSINIQSLQGLQDKERKRTRALPPDGWLGESRSVKKRQVWYFISWCENLIWIQHLASCMHIPIFDNSLHQLGGRASGAIEAHSWDIWGLKFATDPKLWRDPDSAEESQPWCVLTLLQQAQYEWQEWLDPVTCQEWQTFWV